MPFGAHTHTIILRLFPSLDFCAKKKMGALFYFPFVCISVHANVYFMTILRECLRGLPSTVPRPVFDSAVLGTLSVSVWIANQKKTQHDSRSNMARYLRLFQITFFLSDYLVNRVEKKIARIFQKKIVVMDAFVVWNPQTHP